MALKGCIHKIVREIDIRHGHCKGLRSIPKSTAVEADLGETVVARVVVGVMVDTE